LYFAVGELIHLPTRLETEEPIKGMGTCWDNMEMENTPLVRRYSQVRLSLLILKATNTGSAVILMRLLMI